MFNNALLPKIYIFSFGIIINLFEWSLYGCICYLPEATNMFANKGMETTLLL